MQAYRANYGKEKSIMQKRNLAVFALAALSLVSLVGCGEGRGDTPASSTTDETTSSTSSSGPAATKNPVTTLENSSIRAGMTFLDAGRPNTIYVDPSRNININFGDGGSFTLTATDGTIYEADEPLPAGKYEVKGKFNVGGGRMKSNNFEFSVTEGTVATDKGVNKSVTKESLSPFKFMNYPGMDTLGRVNTPSGCMPSFGDSKVLVIPVEFKNTSFGTVNISGTNIDKSQATAGRETAREMLREAFFAENDKTQEPGADGKIPDTTPWESLHSYYKKASFGQLNITGAVTPVYEYGKGDGSSTDPFKTSYSDSFAGVLAQEAVQYFTTNKTVIDGKPFDPKDYDADGDGFIDGVEMVYVTDNLTPQGENDNSIWWNYTTSTNASPNKNSPSVARVFFSRWDYLINSYYSDHTYDAYGTRVDGKSVDAHTIVHETGHMMGAPDYYSYDKKEGPAGCVDMMDNNVGDHNAYTKMAFGWVAPWVVDYSSDDFEITLPSYTETGNFLIVPAEGKPWNGTPWDEYVLIEYYTPTGVNEEDSAGYAEWQVASANGGAMYGHGGTYRRPGLQMFHVDSRASSKQGTTAADAKANYTDTPKAYDTTTSTSYESSANRVHTNTPTANGRASKDGVTGELTPNRELHAIYPSSENGLDSPSYYSTFGCMSNLFGLKSYFEASGESYGDQPDTKYGNDFYSPSRNQNYFPNKKNFDNGKPFPWSIEITAQTDDSVTLHFVNNNAI